MSIKGAFIIVVSAAALLGTAYIAYRSSYWGSGVSVCSSVPATANHGQPVALCSERTGFWYSTVSYQWSDANCSGSFAPAPPQTANPSWTPFNLTGGPITCELEVTATTQTHSGIFAFSVSDKHAITVHSGTLNVLVIPGNGTNPNCSKRENLTATETQLQADKIRDRLNNESWINATTANGIGFNKSEQDWTVGGGQVTSSDVVVLLHNDSNYGNLSSVGAGVLTGFVSAGGGLIVGGSALKSIWKNHATQLGDIMPAEEPPGCQAISNVPVEYNRMLNIPGLNLPSSITFITQLECELLVCAHACSATNVVYQGERPDMSGRKIGVYTRQAGLGRVVAFSALSTPAGSLYNGCNHLPDDTFEWNDADVQNVLVAMVRWASGQ